MTENKAATRRTFWWTVFIVFSAVCAIDLAVWLGLQTLGHNISPLLTAAPGMSEVTSTIQAFHSLEQGVLLYALPSTFLLFVLVVAALRLVYRSTDRTTESQVILEQKPAAQESEKDRKEKKARDRRLFLHLLSVLQREGRLIDFFAEDLSGYDDAQIGTAVREIHATCRKVVEKSLSLKPVIDQIEGEAVTVETGFDPSAIKLVGEVSGDPPFSGVLRHRGWRSGKSDLPTLSGNQDPAVIAPAEVEILT